MWVPGPDPPFLHPAPRRPQQPAHAGAPGCPPPGGKCRESTVETHVTTGLMYLPTPWRYVWGPWLPCWGWLVLAVLSRAAASSRVFFRSSAICGRQGSVWPGALGPGGAPGDGTGPECPPHLGVGFLVGVHKHCGGVHANLLLVGAGGGEQSRRMPPARLGPAQCQA